MVALFLIWVGVVGVSTAWVVQTFNIESGLIFYPLCGLAFTIMFCGPAALSWLFRRR